MLDDGAEVEAGVLDGAGQHVTEEGVENQNAGHDDQSPARGTASDFKHQKHGDAAEELGGRRNLVDVAHARRDFVQMHAVPHGNGQGEQGQAQVEEHAPCGLLFVLIVFSAWNIQENQCRDERHKDDAHHGTVQDSEA